MPPRTFQPLWLPSLFQKIRSPFHTAIQEDDQRYRDHDYHHSTINAENVPASDWTYDPTFGIIHNEDCSVCRSYKTHLFAANLSSEASFENALGAREERVTSAFSDGVQTGRQLQQEDDRLQLACCREERDKALRSLDEQIKLLEETRNEMKALQNQVVAAVDKLSKKVNEVSTEAHTRTLEDGMSRMKVNSLVDMDYLDAPPPTSPSTISLSLWSDHDILAPDSPLTDKKTKEASDLAKSPETLDGTEVSNENTPQAREVLSFMMPSEVMMAEPAMPFSIPLKPLAYPTGLVPPRGSNSPQYFPTSADLRAAMNAASAGDISCLMKVRAFSALAHATPRRERTRCQQYVIKHWRPPLSMPTSSMQTDTFSAEAYVDASQWGIGFVMNGFWLAWKFVDSTVLPGSHFDSSWAEMLAVEVGVWTTIHCLCYAIQKEGDNLKSLKILVRSDNAGVVKAIEKRHTNHPLLQDILRRILHMVNEFDLELTVKWIPGKDNLADKMSRGVPGHVEDLLPLIPPVPPYLSDILNLSRQVSDAVAILV